MRGAAKWPATLQELVVRDFMRQRKGDLPAGLHEFVQWLSFLKRLLGQCGDFRVCRCGIEALLPAGSGVFTRLLYSYLAGARIASGPIRSVGSGTIGCTVTAKATSKPKPAVGGSDSWFAQPAPPSWAPIARALIGARLLAVGLRAPDAALPVQRYTSGAQRIRATNHNAPPVLLCRFCC